MTNPIQDFWTWFAANSSELFENPDNTTLLAELDAKLGRIHSRIGWEIGPSNGSGMFFAVSPSLDLKLVPTAQRVVEQAPRLSGWVFLLGRQRRAWSSIVELANEFGEQERRLDLEDLSHVALRAKGEERTDVLFATRAASLLGDDDREELAYIIVQGLIGELLVMERVDDVQLLEELPKNLRAKARPAALLPYAFGLQPL